MPLFAPRPRIDLPVVLELSRQSDGSARGELDGVPVVLGADHTLRIPLAGAWPDATRLLPNPPSRPLGCSALRNRSRYPGWMAVALAQVLARPEHNAAAKVLSSDGVRVEVSDEALRLRWTAETDGPSVRRTVRDVLGLARALPAAMAQGVTAAIAALASEKESLSRQYLAAEARTVPWTYGAVLGGVPAMIGAALLCAAAGRPSAIPIAAMAAAIATFATCLAMGQRRATYVCPRCHALWSARPRELRRNPRCPHCGLSPTRAPFQPMALD